MPRLLPAAAAATTLAGLVLGACGSGSAAGALAGKTPAQILQAAVDAADKQSSVHYVLQATGGSAKQTIAGDAGTTDGEQTVTTGANTVQVLVIGTAAYLQGNVGGLQQTLGLPADAAAQAAGKWISVAQSDTLYQPITGAITLHGILQQLKPTGTLQESTPGKVGGKEVVGVRGGLPSNTANGVNGSAVLYVATSTPTLPVGFSGQATTTVSGQSQTVTDIGAFTNWNEPLHLQAPPSSIPFASLPKT